MRSPRAKCCSMAQDILGLDPSERAVGRPVPCLPVPDRNPRRRHHDLPQGRHQRPAQGARRGRTDDARLHARGQGRRPRPPCRQRHAEARPQCRLFRRREEARRNPADGAAEAQDVRPRRDRFRPRYRCAEGGVRGRQRAARSATARCWSSPTTSACSTTSCPMSCTSSPTAGSSRAATRSLALELEAKGYAGFDEAAA